MVRRSGTRKSTEIYFWMWNVRMMSKAQLVDLVTAISKTIRWTMLALQEAAMETEGASTIYTPAGHVVYVNKAEAHARSTAMVVHTDWVFFCRRSTVAIATSASTLPSARGAR